jgi:ribosomal protein L12E/L44/L45/RPP1/RPP2
MTLRDWKRAAESGSIDAYWRDRRAGVEAKVATKKKEAEEEEEEEEEEEKEVLLLEH